MNTDVQIEEISAAVKNLRAGAGDGPTTRKLLDQLFRNVHNLKATAAANSLDDLAAAAHEFEDVLHWLRTSNTAGDTEALQLLSKTIPADIWNSLKPEEKHALKQSTAEDAQLFLVQTSFEVADFQQRFQSLKETLSQTGEVISTSPKVDNERSGKLNFRILYAQTNENAPELSNVSDVTVEQISLPTISPTEQSELLDHVLALEHCLEKLSREIVHLKDTPAESPLQQALRAGQAAALATGKEVDFEIRGEDLLLDKAVSDAVVHPLIHLVRNAVDHGIEHQDERINIGKSARGKIVIEAVADQGQTRFKITDDGRGIDSPILDLIFGPGFSTASNVTEISGRGVGLDAVRAAITDLGGSVTVNSEPGKGSSFEITIPDSTHPR